MAVADAVLPSPQPRRRRSPSWRWRSCASASPRCWCSGASSASRREPSPACASPLRGSPPRPQPRRSWRAAPGARAPPPSSSSRSSRNGAFKVCVYSFLALLALAALLVCVACVVAVVSGSISGFKKGAFRAIPRESVAGLFRILRPVVLGLVADVAFFLLVVAGHLVAMMSPHVEGSISQGEMVGSVMEDVARFGMHATACVMIPAVVLGLWREYQADRKAPSQSC